MGYYENYVPADQQRFTEMLEDFRRLTSREALKTHVFLYTMDMRYDRQDLMVAWGRVEREKGWKD
jgi:hypothetical protein